MKKAIFVMMFLTLGAVIANADVVISHSGAADPTSEGWTQTGGGTVTEYGKPDDSDGVVSDVACWHITTPTYGSRGYTYDLTGVDLSEGWVYTIDMRSWDTVGIMGTYFNISDGANSWSIFFEARNTISVWMQGGSAYRQVLKDDADLTLYNVYQLYYNPTIDPDMIYLTMDNGATHLCSWPRSAAPTTTNISVSWGNGSTGASNNMRVASVVFETVQFVPEIPSETIVSHSGVTNPTSEGWTQTGGGTFTVFGKPDDSDGVVSDVACWHINTPSYGSCGYTYDLTGVDLSKGWRYTLDMRSWDTVGIFGTYFQVCDGANSWGIFFEARDTISAWMQGGSAYRQILKDDANLLLYNVYQLYYNPVNDPDMVYLTMDDGETHLCSWPRAAAPTTTNLSVNWGNGSTSAVNNMRVASVKFETVEFPADEALPGDANNDGMVDVGDLGILAANYGMVGGATWDLGDFNGDGSVDVGDLGILAANYGLGTSGVNWDADYAKVFGTAKDAEEVDEADSNLICSGVGLPLIAGLGLMGLMLVKLDE